MLAGRHHQTPAAATSCSPRWSPAPGEPGDGGCLLLAEGTADHRDPVEAPEHRRSLGWIVGAATTCPSATNATCPWNCSRARSSHAREPDFVRRSRTVQPLPATSSARASRTRPSGLGRPEVVAGRVGAALPDPGSTTHSSGFAVRRLVVGTTGSAWTAGTSHERHLRRGVDTIGAGHRARRRAGRAKQRQHRRGSRRRARDARRRRRGHPTSEAKTTTAARTHASRRGHSSVLVKRLGST